MRLGLGQIHRLHSPRGMGQASLGPPTITQIPGTTGSCGEQVSFAGYPGPYMSVDCWNGIPQPTQQTLAATYPAIYNAANGYVVGATGGSTYPGEFPQPTQAGLTTPVVATPSTSSAAPAGNTSSQQIGTQAASTSISAPIYAVPISQPSSNGTWSSISDWFTETSIDSIPNWVLVAGGVVLVWWLMARGR